LWVVKGMVEFTTQLSAELKEKDFHMAEREQ